MDYALNKAGNAAMRVEALMEALHVPAERWQSSLSDDVFGRISAVNTLAVRERAAAPKRVEAPQGPHYVPIKPDRGREQPARAAKRKPRQPSP